MDSDPQSILAPPGTIPDSEPTIDSAPTRGRIYLVRTLLWILIAAALVISFREGIRLRRWVFDITDPIRYLDDIHRGCYWGLNASGPEGYLNQYDKMQDQKPDQVDSRWIPWLDYAPLRLLVMREWGVWQRVHFPPDPDTPLINAWQHPYAFNAPVLWFNTAMEIFAAFCAFCLTRLWVVRGNGGTPRNHFDGIWQGLVAALLIWFSPDILLERARVDHVGLLGRPLVFMRRSPGQPRLVVRRRPRHGHRRDVQGAGTDGRPHLYHLAARAVAIRRRPPMADRPHLRNCRNRFGLDADLSPRGQPRARPAGAAIYRCGQLSARSFRNPPRLRHSRRHLDRRIDSRRRGHPVDTAKSVAPRSSDRALSPQTILHSRWTWAVAALILVTASIYWPFLLRNNRPYWYVGILGGAALAAASIALRPKNQPYVLAGVAGAGLLLCMLLFHGGTGWARCTFEFGTIHWPFMVMGLTDNIPGIFEARFGWSHMADDIAFTLPAIAHHWPAFIAGRAWWPAADVDVSAKTLFDSIFSFFLLLSGIAVGLQARRRTAECSSRL